jgi:tellurite resistance protein
MANTDWERIAPLVAATTMTADAMVVTFRCPVSGFSADARGPLGFQQPPADSNRTRLGRWFSNMFGRRPAPADHPAPPAETQHQAILAAFRTVAHLFGPDPRTGALVAAFVVTDLQTPFSRVLNACSFDSPPLRLLLARVLAGVAVVDGQIDPSERRWFDEFVGADPGLALDNVLQLAPPNALDFDGLSAAHREGLWLLASAMALADEIHDPGERFELQRLAHELGLSADDQHALFEAARDQMLGEAIAAALADGDLAPAEQAAIAGLATRLGVSGEHLFHLEADYRERVGLPPRDVRAEVATAISEEPATPTDA